MIKSKKPSVKICNVCKTEFKPYTSLDKYCSANCRIENMKQGRSRRWNKESTEKIKGENNPSYKHGNRVIGKVPKGDGIRLFIKNRNELKSVMMEMTGYLYCEHCGVSNVRYESHHIVYRSEKPNHPNLHDIDNILLLCVPCHNVFHTKKSIRNEIVLKRNLAVIFGNDILDK